LDTTEETHDDGEKDGNDAEETEGLRRRLEQQEARVEELRDELESREDRVEELESRVKRVQADFKNYKRRSDEKVERAAERATESVVEDFLGVRDDLERALDAEGSVKELREGIEMTLGTFDEVLSKHGVERVPVEEFDPEKHQAMMRVDSEDHEEGEIVDVYEPGYEIDGSVVRPAKVTVAEAGGGDEDSDN